MPPDSFARSTAGATPSTKNSSPDDLRVIDLDPHALSDPRSRWPCARVETDWFDVAAVGRSR